MPSKSLALNVFGTLPDGDAVQLITLTNEQGMTVRLIGLGASIQSVCVPDREGNFADVTAGYANLPDYLEKPQYFGATVGRVANRIAGGRFTLDGKAHSVPQNDGPNSLHGGTQGFDRVNWQLVGHDENDLSVTFRYVSPDGDQGYPGALTTTATYRLGDDNALTVEYHATTDAPTLVNLSNHAYWNLSGDGGPRDAMDHLLTIHAAQYLPVDAALIPTGERRDVVGTAFDFRAARRIGDAVRDASDAQIAHGRGYDHNWIVGDGVAAEPRDIAYLQDPHSGRTMTLSSNQPGLQFYSGNFFDASTAGKSGRLYRMGDAIALEPQQFPDTPNQPSFGSIRLDPGQTYRNIIRWQFGISNEDIS